MNIDPSHPRAISLKIRGQLVWGKKQGLTSAAGLIAHGRGEAFDYLLGEKTQKFAQEAIRAAAAYLLLAKQPILSSNGNSSVLATKEFIKLCHLLNCKIEVNLFHFTKKRAELIEDYFDKLSPGCVLLSRRNIPVVISNIASCRKVVLREGIGSADVVLVPLEDGDRCQALSRLGKRVITIDLNPISRTAKKAAVTIVDNIVRAMPLLIQEIEDLKRSPKSQLIKITQTYNNKKILSVALQFINNRLVILAKRQI